MQRRDAYGVRKVHRDARRLKEQFHDIRVVVLCRDEQGRRAFVVGAVDVDVARREEQRDDFWLVLEDGGKQPLRNLNRSIPVSGPVARNHI